MTDHLKEQCIDTLEKLASLSEIAELNPFKIKAYKNASKALSEFSGDFAAALGRDELKQIPGVGKGILAIIAQVACGKIPQELHELSAIVPITLLDLLKIDGLGPKRARLLWQELDIKNLGELEYALQENRLKTLKGFSEKLCQNMTKSINELHKNVGLFRLDQLMKAFGQLKSLTKLDFDLAGHVSRAEECATGLDLSLLWPDSLDKLDSLVKNIAQNAVTQPANNIMRLAVGPISCEIAIGLEPKAYGPHLLFRRCEKGFWQKLINHAHQKSFTLSQDGLRKDGVLLDMPTEDHVFTALKIHPIPAERRSDTSVFVSQGQVYEKLIELPDLKGAFHNHTVASDGKHTLREMRQRAIELGLSYLGISDHSQSAFYANGLKDDRLKNQLAEISTLNDDEQGQVCHLLSGTESDILADGSLDFPADLLKKLDVVIASVHSRLKQDHEQMTNRMVNAAKNPYTTIVGHPTGRLILDRPKSSFDMRALIEAASQAGTALELNANPHRLDLDFRDLGLAKEAGVLIAINADAHSTDGLNDLSYGIMIARKAGLTPQDVLNSLDLKDIKKWLNQKREKNIPHD